MPALALPPNYPEKPVARLTLPPAHDDSELQVLFWNEAQRSQRFRAMEQWFAGHEVPAAPRPRVLPKGEPLGAELESEIAAVMASTNTAGIMVLVDGKVRYEAYRLGLRPEDRWTSFSVAKSFTSTLLGAAIKDGFITSLDESVTRYIPDLAGSAYEGVTIKQLATMTSGVKWNEDYTDPNSDVAQMNRFVIEYGPEAIIAQMKALPREAEPGSKWVYKTGETNLIGVLVENAVGKPLAEYAKDKIVDPAGFAGGCSGWLIREAGISAAAACRSRSPTMPAWASSCSKGARAWCPRAGLPRRPPAPLPSAKTGLAMATSGGPTHKAPLARRGSSGRGSRSSPSSRWCLPTLATGCRRAVARSASSCLTSAARLPTRSGEHGRAALPPMIQITCR
jgi:CubicO group peptidase (beta-lactamase class C family)